MNVARLSTRSRDVYSTVTLSRRLSLMQRNSKGEYIAECGRFARIAVAVSLAYVD